MMRFFFSSRRRHTRYWRDWSSDVCSSDLAAAPDAGPVAPAAPPAVLELAPATPERSEERRVGKERGTQEWREHKRQNDPHDAPGESFPESDLVCATLKDAEVQRQHRPNK